MNEIAVFGGGCFWCTEAVFIRLSGVLSVVSGYSDGHVENPTYEDICSGNSGHAEVIQITFDPNKIQYKDLLAVFFSTHDPTTINQQGNDIGTQYRSIILACNDKQLTQAQDFVVGLNDSGVYSGKIVTEIKKINVFYAAENYHQDFFNKNPYQGYCNVVIPPKLNKLENLFSDLLKKS